MTVVTFFFIVSVLFILYGALVISGKFVPPTAKNLMKEEELPEWCKEEGKIRILWGLDIALLAMYLQGSFLPYLWGGVFLIFTVYIIYITYINNDKHMKN